MSQSIAEQGASPQGQTPPVSDDDETANGTTATGDDTSFDLSHLVRIVESLIFVAEQPVKAQRLARVVGCTVPQVRTAIERLQQDYRERGIELAEVAGGYRFRSSPACGPQVQDFLAQRPVKLSRAQLETLSIVAYRQPVTRPEMDEIRGVDCASSAKVLLERGFVKILGRKEEAGRPLLYGTTEHFLQFFGLGSLKELPTLSEFTELTAESKSLFERRMGEPLNTSAPNAPVADTAEQNGESAASPPPAHGDLEDVDHDIQT